MIRQPKLFLSFAALLGMVLSALVALPAAAADEATLTVSRTGGGSGSVTGSGISCGSDCSQTYDAGTDVTLTANETATSVFTGWSGGGCSGLAPCEVSVDSDTLVQANFRECTITKNYIYYGTSYIFGTINDDVVCGTSANDAIIDFQGNDIIGGKAGQDVILGNMGNDFISGGPDQDFLYGELGDDVLVGGPGNDYGYGDIPIEGVPQGNDVCDVEHKLWNCE